MNDAWHMEGWKVTQTATKQKSAPGFERHPEYKLRTEAAGHRVRVTIGETVIADTHRALLMYENDMTPTYYFPRGDIDMKHFRRTDSKTYCSFKGEASYWAIESDGSDAGNAAWSYESPYKESAEIREYIAFYPGKVRIKTND